MQDHSNPRRHPERYGAQWLEAGRRALVRFVYRLRLEIERGLPEPVEGRWPANAAILLVSLALGGILGIAATVALIHGYMSYVGIVEQRLAGEVFASPARIYAAPYVLYPGQEARVDETVARLRRAGFERIDEAALEGRAYSVTVTGPAASVVVSPEGRPDYRLDFRDGFLEKAVEVSSRQVLDRVELPPELVTTLFDDTRSKRRIVEWEELPPHLIDAILASEDRRFYRHSGIDFVRGAGAAYANLRGMDRQGASTLTMQLAGSFFLDRRERTWSRKLPEILMALILEQRLTKRQILTMYANEMYLGHRGSFAVNGFGEAAAVYFGKDVAELTLAEAATLVGLLPAPNAYSPLRNPERSVERRNTVLTTMRELDMISDAELAQAAGEALFVAETGAADSNGAPYMVDYVREALLQDFSESELLHGSMKVYTTLDPDLQRAAVDAVEKGVTEVESRLEARGRGPASGEPPVQAALIVLDADTGAIRAMVGGRDYGDSQYNRVTEARRQPGSVFKPFVYAAALETAFDPLPAEPELAPVLDEWRFASPRFRRDSVPGDTDGLISDLDRIPHRDERGTIRRDAVITPLTTLTDEPTYFFYGRNRYYRPDNYGGDFHGLITVREALERSLNVATVKIAERIGYDRVRRMARRVGLDAEVGSYPSAALGAFEVAPMEIAGAWTVLANLGVRVEPRAIESVRTGNGEFVAVYPPRASSVLRPEIAAVMTNLLENVVDRGSGAAVRSRGFTSPAAGKTGTSRDGWFAGYTTDLLAIAWVGFDDNRELGLEGARSALPIWTWFMMEAEGISAGEGGDSAFVNPRGVEVVEIDAETLSLASPDCVDRYSQAFVRGTAPASFCPLHSGGFPGGAFRGIGRALRGLFQ